jgi:NADH:ubiquinone reductase (H+-translocating)
MNAKRIIVLGGGFAGLWSAVGAARKRGELGLNESDLSITLVNRDAYHGIRVRNYEADLSEVRVPLDDVLQPISVERIEGSVIDIDVVTRQVKVESAANNSEQMLGYDRLVMALGSELVRPNVPGLAEHGFDIDTYDGAARLQSHLTSLPEGDGKDGQFTVLVVGAGLTGIEFATEMPARLRALWERANVKQPLRVILADRNPLVGSDMGDSARPVIERALAELGIETRLGCRVVEVNGNGAVLDGGERIAAATVVWCAGMRAHPLAARFPVERDRFGRVDVDEFMRVKDVPNVFAAGDVARAMLDETHASVMSCQHGRPMGRFAGHNVVCNLLGLPMLPLRIDWYVTVLDLGPSSAVYTAGWDRQVVAEGEAAKQTKQIINCQRIYPPLNRDRAAILAAAEPVVQRPPGI